MAEITLVRHEAAMSEAELAGARKMIFTLVDGLSEEDRRAWRRMWRMVLKLEAGETLKVKTTMARLPAFHNRHMRIERLIYEAQENFTDFENGFREWLKVGAGWCDWSNDANGRLTLVTRSTDFKSTDEVGMREFHDKSMAFLRSERGAPVLWPHLKPQDAINRMEAMMEGFGE